MGTIFRRIKGDNMNIIFDVDGTLLDSMHVWLNPMDELFEKYNFKLSDLPKEKKGELESYSFSDMCHFIADNLATDMSFDDVIDYLISNIEDSYKNSLELKPGIREFLDKLKEENIKMSVASSTDFKFLEMALKRLGIFDYFEFFATPDLTNLTKADKKYWEYSISKHGLEPDQLVLFDDALYAIKAAKSAGIKTIGVKDFPHNKGEWDDIVKEADLTLDQANLMNIEKIKDSKILKNNIF